MIEFRINQLRLNINNAAGHEHRVHPIVRRAAVLLAERVEPRWPGEGNEPTAGDLESLSATPVDLNLSRMSDEQAADAVASAWLEALALKLGV